MPFPHLVVRASHSEGSVEGSPKSGKTRQIPVDGYVEPVLDFRARGRGMGEYLFTTVSGAQFSVRNARRDMGWSVVCAGHTWHDLRHTAAVEWAQMSSVLSTADIQRLLGHASLSTTEGYLQGLSGTLRQTHVSRVFQGLCPVSQGQNRAGSADSDRYAGVV